MFESAVLPVLTYGSQAWATIKSQMKKLQVTQNSMLRSILGIRVKDKVSLDQIYSKTKAKKIWGVVKTLKMLSLIHI